MMTEHLLKENITEPARELGRCMLEMRNLLRKHIQLKIKEHNIDITFELLEVLAFLFRKDGVKQQEIADVMVKDKSSMTYLIDGLVKRNMVARLEDENDRRNKIIILTKDGKIFQKKFQPWITEIYASATAGIKLADIDKAILLLNNMNNNLNK